MIIYLLFICEYFSINFCIYTWRDMNSSSNWYFIKISRKSLCIKVYATAKWAYKNAQDCSVYILSWQFFLVLKTLGRGTVVANQQQAVPSQKAGLNQFGLCVSKTEEVVCIHCAYNSAVTGGETYEMLLLCFMRKQNAPLGYSTTFPLQYLMVYEACLAI